MWGIGVLLDASTNAYSHKKREGLQTSMLTKKSVFRRRGSKSRPKCSLNASKYIVCHFKSLANVHQTTCSWQILVTNNNVLQMFIHFSCEFLPRLPRLPAADVLGRCPELLGLLQLEGHLGHWKGQSVRRPKAFLEIRIQIGLLWSSAQLVYCSKKAWYCFSTMEWTTMWIYVSYIGSRVETVSKTIV